MPLPGGPSDKLGNRYEMWWTVSELLRLVKGETESIRIEKPGVDIAEFVVQRDGHDVFHQAKRSCSSGSWSLTALGSRGQELLAPIYGLLRGNQSRFVFVSGSDAPELRELVDRASAAESTSEFETYFLSAHKWAANFQTLKEEWGNPDLRTCYDILKRIEVRTIGERDLTEKVMEGIKAYLLGDAQTIAALLRAKIEDSVHQTIRRLDLLRWLEDNGIQECSLPNPATAISRIQAVTRAYIERAKRERHGRTHISRVLSKELIDSIKNADASLDCVLTGRAGVGKSSCIVDLVEGLENSGITALVFRLDRVQPTTNTGDLGIELKLGESPAHVLAGAAGQGQAVLIVDQLDAVSTTSGRSIQFVETVSDLLKEIRVWRSSRIVHTVLACREFDWKNDRRLRGLVGDDACQFAVSEYSPEETQRVLEDGGFDPKSLQARQIELLRLPQNLTMFLECGFKPEDARDFRTRRELYDEYWRRKRESVNARVSPQSDQWEPVVKCLCEEMAQSQQLSVPRERVDRFESRYVEQMCSESVLSFDGKRYSFAHESFFDYCFARLYVNEKRTLVDLLTGSEQHLFRRAQVRQILDYLRDADRRRYIDELRLIIEDERIRVHIKDIAVTLLTSVQDPSEDEWSVVEPYVRTELDALKVGQEVEDKLCKRISLTFFRSPFWFQYNVHRGEVADWLLSGEPAIANLATWYLRIHQREFPDDVAELLTPYVDQGGEWPQRLLYTVEWATQGKSRKFFELFLRLLDNGTLEQSQTHNPALDRFWSMVRELNGSHPDWMAEVVAHWLRKRFGVEGAQDRGQDEATPLEHVDYGRYGASCIREAAEKDPDGFVAQVFREVITVSDATILTDQNDLPIRDKVWG